MRISTNKLVLAVAFLLFCAFVVGYFIGKSSVTSFLTSFSVPESTITPSVDEKFISGLITSVSDRQPADGNCEVIVNNMRIAVAIGGDRMPTMIPKEKGEIKGVTCNTKELSQYIGQNLEAYGKWNGYYLTVEGNKNYFIKVKNAGEIGADSRPGEEVDPPFLLNDPNAQYSIRGGYLVYVNGTNKKTAPIAKNIDGFSPGESWELNHDFDIYEGKNIVVNGNFKKVEERIECVNAPCGPIKRVVIYINSVRIK